jgi:transposase
MKIQLSKFKSLVPMSLLDELAIEYSVNTQNQVKLPGQAVFLCLLNGLLNHPELTQRMLEEQYEKLTGKSCDHSSFGKRLSGMDSDYIQAILAHLRKVIGPYVTKGDIQALKLRIIDATIVTLSAKLLDFGIKANHGGKGLKSQIKSVIELSDEGLPNLLHICKTQSEFSDVVALGETIKANTKTGDLWVFDKGCHSRHVLYSVHNRGSFWITPHSTQNLTVIDTLYERSPDVPEIPQGNEPVLRIHRVELAIFSNKRDKIDGLESMKLVVIHSHRWDMRNKKWTPFVLMTNLPLSECKSKAGSYSFEEIAELYRRRWEIETFFKLLKAHLSYEHVTSRSENGIRIMILMSMIAALLMIWYKQQTNIKNGWKAVKFWLADDVRAWTSRSIHAMKICIT